MSFDTSSQSIQKQYNYQAQQQQQQEPNGNTETNMCLELALEGERLCKAGDCRAGIAFFQAAIQAGTDDLRTLSAIYSQLGNAYFYLGDYEMAMQYHKHDLTLTRSIGDKLGEAKSSGNLGNTFKVMGKFDEAIICCKRHLLISREIGDKLSEGRALYNLGNVYHAKGKQGSRLGQKGPGEYSEEVKECLLQAISYYQENLDLMKELKDSAGQGRACGNLGNSYYLLGNFQRAIYYHNERLKIAKEFGDKAAERRANSNLGNSHIFLGEFEKAAQHYRRTLILAQELEDQALEAQACYSLGNTYTLLHDYTSAIEYHLRHYLIAQKLKDKVGEGRACWSLGNAYSAMGNHSEALNFARSHLEISKDIGDTIGEATAQVNVEDLQKILKLNDNDDTGKEEDGLSNDAQNPAATSSCRYRLRRRSMDQLNLIKLTPDGKSTKSKVTDINGFLQNSGSLDDQEEDNFLDLLSRFQSERMNDQRCELKKKQIKVEKNVNNDKEEDLVNLISKIQCRRMDEQRVTLPYLPGLKENVQSNGETKHNAAAPTTNKGGSSTGSEDSFIEMLIKCQGSRLDDQRSTLPNNSGEENHSLGLIGQENKNETASTVPEDDLFALVQKIQAARMEDQRASNPYET